MDALLSTGAIPAAADSGYNIDNSLKCQANSGNEWFYRNSPTAGNKKTFTFSFWIKRTQLDGYEADNYLMSQGSNARFHFAGHTLRFMFDGNSTEMEAAGKLRDTSAWYHIVLAIDTTQATNTNRVKAYVNGESYAFNNNDWPSLNQESSWMSGTNMYFNTRDGDGSYDNSGYWAEIAVVDGQALAPTSFGEYNDDGIWIPKDLSDITFGNEGFWWNFSDASNLGADSSGNSNTATFNNLTTADLATDTPTNNFCTWNPLLEPLQRDQYGNVRTISEGGTKVTGSTAWGGVKGTIGVTNGKWYWENKASGNDTIIGWQTENYTPDSGTNSHNVIDTVALYQDGNYVWIKDSTSGRNDTSASGTNASGQIMGFALDLDSSPQTATFYRNGSAIASNVNIDGATGKTLFPFMSQYNQSAETNFGAYTTFTISSSNTDANGYGTFEYAPPSGYYAICTKNLAEYG